MKYLRVCLIVLSFVISTTGFAGPYAEFDGNFEQVSSEPGCENIFDRTAYRIKFFLVGPNYRTVVMNLSTEEKQGFFHAVNLVSNFGYNNDYVFNKTIDNELGEYQVEVKGFVTTDVTLSSFNILHIESGCQATAELSGFSRYDF